MKSGPTITIARWKVPAESASRVLALVAELRQRSLEEPGCLGYEVLQDVDARESLVLIERYADAAALAAHRNSDHYRELLRGRVLPLLASRDIEILRENEA